MTFQWPFVAWGTATGFMMLYVNHLNHCLKWDLKIELVEFMVEETKKISSGKCCPVVSLTASNHSILVEDVAPPSGDKVAERKSAQGWNSTGLPFSFQGSLCLFQCLDQALFLIKAGPQGQESANGEKKTTRLCASVHVLLSPFPIQRLICSALQHAECQVAVYLLSMFHYALSIIAFFYCDKYCTRQAPLAAWTLISLG